MNFEETMKQLEEITAELEKGDLNLEESVKKFEQGMELSKKASKILEESEKKINILIQKENEIVEESFTGDDN